MFLGFQPMYHEIHPIYVFKFDDFIFNSRLNHPNYLEIQLSFLRIESMYLGIHPKYL